MSAAQAEFVEKYNSLVNRLVAGTGIYPETIFAQAIVESQKNGLVPNTLLATKYNNLFGIKDSDDWTGDVVNLSTGEVYNGQNQVVTAGFRVYNSPDESFADYVDFLKSNKRYSDAGVFNAKNYTEQLQDIANAGYATNPSYGQLITSVANGISQYITPVNVGMGLLLVGILVYGFYHFYKYSA